MEPSEFPSPTIIDSRRLLGPNLYDGRFGAVLDVTCDEARAGALVGAWFTHARSLARALGWDRAALRARRTRAGASLFLPAPIDVLMCATEVNEQAWVCAEAGEERPDDAVVTRLRATANAERRTRPHLADAYATAVTTGITASFDEQSLCLGSGNGSRVWPFGDLPPAAEIAWREVRDVPIALVTGTNGKTTTTRLVAAMWRAAGRVAGWCCSDGVWVNGVQVASGDYSGPAGAREVLRNARVEAAVLETARGGILRRGLAVSRASAAIITNISADHLGEYGIRALSELAWVKSVVARALPIEGHLVLNADDEQLVTLAERMTAQVSWFSVVPDHPLLGVHVADGGDAAMVRDGRVMLHVGKAWHDLGDVTTMPITLNGTAPHNIANVLGSTLLGAAVGIPVDAMREALATFGGAATDNPGRLQITRLGGVTVLIDFAHNPEGLAALCKTAMAIPATRRLLILGQAGNRGDELIRALPRAAFAVMPFDHVIIKEMISMLRGRAAGEVPRILADELSRLGMCQEQVETVESEIAAIRRAFDWARDGDLIICPAHVNKAEVVGLVRQLSEMGWAPGALEISQVSS